MRLSSWPALLAALGLLLVACRVADADGNCLPGKHLEDLCNCKYQLFGVFLAASSGGLQSSQAVLPAAGCTRFRRGPSILLILNYVLLTAVSAEFVLTGLSNADGNSRNHEIGVCLPQFTLDLTPACRLSIKPKFASNAFISLTQVGEPEPGKPVIPRATDSIAAINDAVTNKLGYYYLDPVRCPQQYTGYVKGNRLLASGGL
jgi:hypothetical protein